MPTLGLALTLVLALRFMVGHKFNFHRSAYFTYISGLNSWTRNFKTHVLYLSDLKVELHVFRSGVKCRVDLIVRRGSLLLVGSDSSQITTISLYHSLFRQKPNNQTTNRITCPHTNILNATNNAPHPPR